MEKSSSKKIVLVVWLLAFLFIFSASAFAAFSVSVTPYEGGVDLRYGNISADTDRINRELTVNIISDAGKQYRLTQALQGPMMTPEGNTLPNGALVVYGIRGTNKYGNLKVEQEVPVSLSKQIIYTSNNTGSADSFTLVYGLLTRDIAPGSYSGRLCFTMEAIDSSLSPSIVIINVYLTVEAKSKIEIRTSLGGKDIRLNPDKEDMKAAAVVVNIAGNFGKQFKILQAVTEQPVSGEGNLLDWDSVKFLGRDAQKGMVINDAKNFSMQPQTVYTSSPRGEADSFVLEYGLGEINGKRVGNYKTRVKYFLETGAGTTTLIDTLNLEVSNPSIFDLVIVPEDMTGRLTFKNLRPDDPAKTSEVSIEVKSNVGRKYQVIQNAYSDLTNKDGLVVPEGNFTLRTVSEDVHGTLKFPSASPVKKGDTTVFVSDSRGSSDKFKIIYELSIPKDMIAGDYSTRITYSLVEI